MEILGWSEIWRTLIDCRNINVKKVMNVPSSLSTTESPSCQVEGTLNFELCLEIALLQKNVVKIQEFGPITFISSHCNIQPRLPKPIIVYNGSLLNLISIDIRTITKAKNMPLSIQQLCLIIESQPA